MTEGSGASWPPPAGLAAAAESVSPGRSAPSAAGVEESREVAQREGRRKHALTSSLV